MNPILKLQTLLQGKKTYILGWLLVLDAVWFLVTGERLVMDSATFDNPAMAPDPINQLVNGGGLVTLRSAISRTTPTKE